MYLLIIVFLYLFCSQGLADNTVIAKVNKVVWDLDRPLEEDCSLELLKFEDEEAQAVSIFYQNIFPFRFTFNSPSSSYLNIYCVKKMKRTGLWFRYICISS